MRCDTSAGLQLAVFGGTWQQLMSSCLVARCQIHSPHWKVSVVTNPGLLLPTGHTKQPVGVVAGEMAVLGLPYVSAAQPARGQSSTGEFLILCSTSVDAAESCAQACSWNLLQQFGQRPPAAQAHRSP